MPLAALVPGGVTVLADSDKGKGSPIGFFVVLVLVIAVYFLYRSMSGHLKKLPESFPDRPSGDAADQPPVLPSADDPTAAGGSGAAAG